MKMLVWSARRMAGVSVRNPQHQLHHQSPGLWRLPGLTESTQQILNHNRNDITRIRVNNFCTSRERPKYAYANPDLKNIFETALGEKDQKKISKNAGLGIIELSKQAENEDKKQLIKDVKFQQMLKILEGDVRRLDSFLLIGVLKSLQNLGVNDDAFVVKNLENALLWVSRSSSINDLLMGVSFCASRQKTGSQKKTFEDLCSIVERRHVELRTGKHFLMLLEVQDKLESQLLARIEDRLIDRIEESPVDKLVQILKVYGQLGRRNIPVIRSLGYHISKNKSSLNIQDICDVLFAFNKLSFKELDTVERVCSGLENLLPENSNSFAVRSILTSLGLLKFNPKPILDLICDWYQQRVTDEKELESRDMSTLLIILAKLNHVPFGREVLFKKASEMLKYDEFKQMPQGQTIWVDIVWSLMVLHRPVTDHLSTILEPSFVKSLIEGNQHVRCWAKLLNLNAEAHLLGDQYKGPKLSNEDIDKLSQCLPAPGAAKIKFKKMVMDRVTTLFPAPRFLNAIPVTRFGVQLDAEIMYDANSKPLEVAPYATTLHPDPNKKELPLGCRRVGIIITNFQDCLVSGGRTGSTSLAVRLLKAHGFIPLVIDFNTIDSSMKAIQGVQKIEVLLKQAIERPQSS